MKVISFLQILVCILLGVCGQILIKKGTMLAKTKGSLLVQYIKIFTTPYVLIGVSLYIISSLIWVKLLQKVPLSWAYPMLSLSYVIMLVGANFFLGETIPLIRWLGVVFISMGVLLIFRS